MTYLHFPCSQNNKNLKNRIKNGHNSTVEYTYGNAYAVINLINRERQPFHPKLMLCPKNHFTFLFSVSKYFPKAKTFKYNLNF